MQVWILVAYSVCEVKPDGINRWMCVQREEFVSGESVVLTVGCVYRERNL